MATLAQPRVELAPDAPTYGFASMLAQMVRQNLDDRPQDHPVFNRMVGRVALIAEDTETEATLCFEGGHLTVHDGIVGLPHLTIRASTDEITRLSALETLGTWRLPDPRGANIRRLARATRRGDLQVHGALANLPLLLRLARVMSVS